MIASDGELYGHHQPFRDKFLAYITGEGYEKQGDVILPIPGLWLKSHPLRKLNTNKGKYIVELSSWSSTLVRYYATAPRMHPGRNPYELHWKILLIYWMNTYYRFAKEYVDDPWELRHCYYPVMHQQMKIRTTHYASTGIRSMDPEVTKNFHY